MSESVRTTSFRTLAVDPALCSTLVCMSTSGHVLVYGATGHTGRFVTDELVRRGLTPVLAGRSAEGLAAVAPRHAALERRVADVDDPDRLRRAVSGVGVVVNCAGPFLDTAAPLAWAAVDSGAHYLDVSAEQGAVQRVYRELDAPARVARLAVVPALAFYGGLADLLVTAALDGDAGADEVEVAIGLDRWWPTDGTRATGARNTAPRQVIRDGVLTPLANPSPTRRWAYPEPIGEQPVVELPFSEAVTIDRHLDVRELRCYLNTGALDDLRDSTTPAPVAADERGRSTQRFVVDVAVRRGSGTRRISCAGRDIYAVTAPIVVEGARPSPRRPPPRTWRTGTRWGLRRRRRARGTGAGSRRVRRAARVSVRHLGARQHAELVAGRVACRTATAARPSPCGSAGAAALDDGGLDVVGVLAGLEPDVEVQPVLGRALGSRLGAQLEEGTPQRRVPQGPGRDRRPRRSSRSARTRTPRPGPGRRSRAGAPRSGPVSAYAARSSMTQQGFPSGSASTTQGTSP